VARPRKLIFVVAFVVALGPLLLAMGCSTAEQDRVAQRRMRAQKTCEDAVSDQLASRSTAQFATDDEHVYYDSAGGAGVTGVVTTPRGQRNFACILKSDTDSTWSLSAARLLN
jgi:hypothetical protein